MSESLTQKAYEAIKEQILQQVLRPGSPISENELSEELGMSRTPLRDAIRRLESEGLVEVIPRKGTYIKSLTQQELVMCYEVSEGLEGMLAYNVATQVREGRLAVLELARLGEIIQELDRCFSEDKPKEWVLGDEAFHGELYRLCDNSILTEYISKIRTQFNCVSWFITPKYVDRAESNREHRALWDALCRGDAQEARSVAQRQRRRIREEIKRVL